MWYEEKEEDEQRGTSADAIYSFVFENKACFVRRQVDALVKALHKTAIC